MKWLYDILKKRYEEPNETQEPAVCSHEFTGKEEFVDGKVKLILTCTKCGETK
jgi:hypothetical protein